MNRQQLRARLRLVAGVELDGLREDAELNDLLTEAYEQIGNLRAWKWREAAGTFDTTEDVDTYALPAEVDEPQGVLVLDAVGHTPPLALRETTLRDLLARIRRDDTDLPRFYARTGERQVRLGPVPDDTYTIEVYGLAPLEGLAEDSDVPEWDSRWHVPIAYLAASIYLDEEGQEELAAHRRERAEEMIADMIDFYQLSKDTTPIIVGGGQGEAFPWRVF